MQPGDLRDDARNYLKQQQELFGDYLVATRKRTTKENDVEETPATQNAETQAEAKVPGDLQAVLRERLATVNEAWVDAPTLEAMHGMIDTCQKCRLGATRTRLVFGSGSPSADIVVIGEAPGADEDATGLPFVGAAGQLLTKILAAINLTRDEVYICNILKSRPPGNRTPLPDEVEACEPYLWKQLALISPRFILALGLTSATTLLRRKARMADLRGSVHDYNGIPMIVTYHPAALLRNPNWKRATWEDVQMLRRLYDEGRSKES